MSASRQAKRRAARASRASADKAIYEVRRVTIQLDVQQFDPKTNQMVHQGQAEAEALCEKDFFPGLQEYITDYMKRRGVLKIRNFVAQEQKAG